MKKILLIIFTLTITNLWAQAPQLELTKSGFKPLTYDIPAIESQKFIALSKEWVGKLKLNNQNFDISNISSGQLTISGYKNNAFYYRNRGETFQHRVKLVMKIDFSTSYYTLSLTIPEIYADYNSLIDYTIPDYFTSDGKLKDGYDGLKESLEKSMNDIALNYYNYISKHY